MKLRVAIDLINIDRGIKRNMKIDVFTLNAFSKAENGGNPAGVILNADYLSEMEMQRIAEKVGFSECAFVNKSDIANFKVRFFTPTAEVDLCGHATIATFSLLAQKGIIGVGEYTQETKAGVLKVEALKDRVIFMQQSNPGFYQEVDKDELAESLNVSNDFIIKNYPAQIVSTGIRDIIIPINTLNQLHDITPDFNKIIAISKKYNAVGYHLFTMDTLYSSTAHCRNFAPLYDIPEEAATGTSNGALGCYLYNYGLVTEEIAGHMVFEQGYSMKRPSEILTSLTIKNKEILEVKVGGVAKDIKEIVIEI
jgi:PhzF family phenazine biosynthesis protein